MAFEKLDEREQQIILQAMKLILIEEKYIGDWAFPSRTGITRDELRQVITEWPNLKDEDDTDSKNNPDLTRVLAINNSLNEVLHGVSVSDEDWEKWFDEPREEVKRVYNAWAVLKGWKHKGLM
jgi:hypothetical protein